jgi:hypothetical protein
LKLSLVITAGVAQHTVGVFAMNHRLTLEKMEERWTPAVSAGVVNQTLVVRGSASQDGGTIEVLKNRQGTDYIVSDSGTEVGRFEAKGGIRNFYRQR